MTSALRSAPLLDTFATAVASMSDTAQPASAAADAFQKLDLGGASSAPSKPSTSAAFKLNLVRG